MSVSYRSTHLVGQATKALSVPVTLASDHDAVHVVVDSSASLTIADSAATATLSNVSASVTSVTLLSANSSRKGAAIWNDSTSVCYVKFGTTASATSCTVKLIADAYYEVPNKYTGRIDAIWVSATGTARVTELT
jgi:hypothetical protein